MKPLSVPQKKIISEFFSNLSVAVLTTGVIIPVFSKPISLFDLLTSVTISLSFSFAFLALSLIMINRKPNK